MMVESGLEEEFLFQRWEFLVSSRLYTRGCTLFCWRFAVTFLDWLNEPLKNSQKEYKGIYIILHALGCLKNAQNNCSKANESNMSSYSRWCHIFNLLSPKFRNIKEILEMNHHHDAAIWFFLRPVLHNGCSSFNSGRLVLIGVGVTTVPCKFHGKLFNMSSIHTP